MNAPRRRTRVTATLLALGVLGPYLVGCTPRGDPRVPQAGPSAGVVPAPEPGRGAGLSTPVADPLYPQYGNPALDVVHYGLALSWSPQRRELSGTATLRIRVVKPVRQISLDFSDSYMVDSATVDGAPAEPGRSGNDLVVPTSRTLAKDAMTTLVVRYRGEPRTVPMPSNRKDFPEGVGLRAATGGEAWTMQEPYGAFTWYPANDQPSDEALYDVAVTVPKGWAGVAHGQLINVDFGDVGDTYHWRAIDPVATYLATLAVGRYTRLTDAGPHGLSITYWLRTGKDESLEPALRKTPALLAWLESHFGPYPFATAGVVIVDSLSAMETQQMVTYGYRLRSDPAHVPRLEVVEEVLLHEFAHHWFGDTITPTNWRGMWLNEGWATYTEWLWSVDKGWDTDAGWEDKARDGDMRSRPQAGPPGNPRPDHFGEHNVYLGPALMLREIHRAVGDAAFFSLARDWVQTQRNQQVDRAGFTAFVNRHTGRNFTTLIDRWLDSPTTPAG
jgi:aminopeptidase N